MKKLLSYVICILCAGSLLIQNLHAQSIGIGVKAGGSLTKLFFSSQLLDEDEDPREYRTRVSFQAGIFIEADFGIFSLQPEAFYSRHRGFTQEDVGIHTNDLEYTFDYVLIPLLAKFETSYGLYGILGPQIGLLARVKQSTIDVIQRDNNPASSTFGRPLDLNGNPIPPFVLDDDGEPELDANGDPIDTTISANDILKKPKDEFEFRMRDYYLVFGGGYEFPFGLGIDVRYNLGIVDLIDKVNAGMHNGQRSKIRATHQVFQISLTYKILETENNQ